MPDIILPPTTEIAESNPFRVLPDQRIGVEAFGLAGAETVIIHRDHGNNVFAPLEAVAGTMTATAMQTSIQISGLYKLVKTATVGAAGASIN